MIRDIGIPRKESRKNKEKEKGSVGQCFMIILDESILFVIVIGVYLEKKFSPI